MDLSKITYFAFQEKHREVYKLLEDSEKCRSMLDEARRELPIIDGLFGCLHEIRRLPEDECRTAFSRIMQDIHMILTLWSLARPADAMKPKAESTLPPASESHLRLRRFGMN